MPPTGSSVSTQVRGAQPEAIAAAPKSQPAMAGNSGRSKADRPAAGPDVGAGAADDATQPDAKDDEKATPSVVREGILTRRSVNKHLGMHRWKDQYFVLDDRSSMAYYHRKSGALRGQIILSHDTNVRPSPKRKHAFEIATPFVTMVMQAKNDKDMEHWMSGVRTVIRALEVSLFVLFF
jgi:hypothetical protein